MNIFQISLFNQKFGYSLKCNFRLLFCTVFDFVFVFSPQHCCMLTLTVLTETQTPFWCVSAPVTITKSNDEEVSYDHHGERFLMEYKDDNGKLEVELEWIKEHEQFVIISFILFLSVSKVNRHFGRDY